MVFDRQAFIDLEIERAIDARGDLAPPWAKYPEIPAGSIGWRMGYGEGWLDVWYEWLSRQPTDRAWRLAYLRRHAAAPRTWDRVALRTFNPNWNGDATDETAQHDLAELKAAGAIGNDVAMLAWEVLHGSSPVAPWAGRAGDSSVAACVRYGARELDFWARWCGSRRASGVLELWLESAPPAPSGWQKLRDAAARGEAADLGSGDSYERLAVLLAAHGHAPAPWVLGEEPASLREELDEDVSYADAWNLWVSERFDDAMTWQRYLGEQGPIPAVWADAIARAIPRL
ncbi:MAG: hypothetical protein H0T76_04915 [Nannocystis sp.]|nr:hypothetical protein [Nannocystis sp.]MBA3545806.1 hypothetical protein [Nannocystis sp.]